MYNLSIYKEIYDIISFDQKRLLKNLHDYCAFKDRFYNMKIIEEIESSSKTETIIRVFRRTFTSAKN